MVPTAKWCVRRIKLSSTSGKHQANMQLPMSTHEDEIGTSLFPSFQHSHMGENTLFSNLFDMASLFWKQG